MAEDSRHEGVQRKVWMPESMNTTVEMMAASASKPVSAVMRDLMAAGLQGEAHSEAALQHTAEVLVGILEPLLSRIDHIERLTYFIAENTAFVFASTESTMQLQAKRMHSDDADAASQSLATGMGRLQGIAHERIRKALRARKPKVEELEGDV